jgi:hypothetical protein
LCLDSLKQRPLVHFAVNGNNNREQGLDNLQLNLVIAFVSTLADCFHDSVDQKPWKTPVLLRRLGVIAVLAVVLAVAIKELVSEQLLNAIEQKLH